jgi:hypothetical protein
LIANAGIIVFRRKGHGITSGNGIGKVGVARLGVGAGREYQQEAEEDGQRIFHIGSGGILF